MLRLLFALMFLTLACWFVSGVFGRPLTATLDGFIQSEPHDFAAAGGGGGAHGELVWEKNDWEGALRRAAEKKRPLLVDFTGIG